MRLKVSKPAYFKLTFLAKLMIYLKLTCTKFIYIFKMNKIIVSILLVLLLVVAINKVADVIFYVQKPEKSAYQVANLADTSSVKKTSASVSDPETENIMKLLASVNASDGEKVFKKCAACHSIAKSGGNKIGPNLWNILGRQAGSVSGYKYSKAMAGYGKLWSVEEMNNFLIKPKEWIKGTKMSFAGLKKGEERASVILYMNENTDNPLSFQ